jgi:hypothetical protein
MDRHMTTFSSMRTGLLEAAACLLASGVLEAKAAACSLGAESWPHCGVVLKSIFQFLKGVNRVTMEIICSGYRGF